MDNFHEENTADSPKSCIVCGMSLADNESPMIREYLSIVYYFCSPECMEKFVEDPEKYIEEEEDEE